MNISNEIDRVFELEIDTLIKVRESLSKDYSKAAQLLFNCDGKVVVRYPGYFSSPG
jgi:D-arabinose 5-phosphate isomerase GutQ